MKTITLAPKQFLDEFVLNVEFCKNAKISNNAYRFWRGVECAKFEGSTTVFLKKSTILEKHAKAVSTCTALDGLVLASAFCTYTGLASSHLTKSNNSSLYEKLEIVTILGVKFVNLRKFYDNLGLDYGYHIYIEKCKFFAPEPLERKIKLTDCLCIGYY